MYASQPCSGSKGPSSLLLAKQNAKDIKWGCIGAHCIGGCRCANVPSTWGVILGISSDMPQRLWFDLVYFRKQYEASFCTHKCDTEIVFDLWLIETVKRRSLNTKIVKKPNSVKLYWAEILITTAKISILINCDMALVTWSMSQSCWRYTF